MIDSFITSDTEVSGSRKAIDNELWKLLRKGDRCRASHYGVEVVGRIVNIVRLSNGRVLFSLRGDDNVELGLFDANRVIPADKDMIRENMTRLDLLLRRFEPRGMSTATASW